MKEIAQEDKDRLKEIYYSVKNLQPMPKNVAEFERLFNIALIIAANYRDGEDHALYTSLQQTKEDYLIALAGLSGYPKQIMIEQLKLYFMGDLLGWI